MNSLYESAVIRIAALMFCLLITARAEAQGGQLPPTVVAAIDSEFAVYNRDGSPGYALGIIKDGRLIFARGYGRANLDDNIPITSRTAFHLASLSKQFTAAAVALLILDGKLALDTPVESFFPEVRKFGADLRIKHLVYFTSGLPEYTSLARTNGSPWFSPYYFTIDEAISTTLKAKSLKFVPGTQWDYSNVDYMLLAKIVERISGMSLAKFLESRVFRPLDMRGSLLNDDSTQIIPSRATGYADRSDPKIRTELEKLGVHVDDAAGYLRLIRNSPHYGGSGVFSSLEDLAKWDENFYSNQLAGSAFTTQMLSRMKFEHDKSNDAFGLVFGAFKGHQMIWFSGGDLDTSTYMARLPDLHLTVICLSNLLTGDAEAKAKRILELLVP